MWRIKQGALVPRTSEGATLRMPTDAIGFPELGPLAVARMVGTFVGTAEDPEFQAMVGLRSPTPCVVQRIDVASREALLLYVDKATPTGQTGDDFSAEELGAIVRAAKEASAALTQIVVRVQPEAAQPTPAVLHLRRPRRPEVPREDDDVVDVSLDDAVAFDVDVEEVREPAPSAQLAALLDAFERGEPNLVRLSHFGHEGLRALALRFPGPLDLGWNADRPSQHGPLLRACVAIGPPMSPWLCAVMREGETLARFYGAYVFLELRDPHCVPTLAALAFDDDLDTREMAIRVLATYRDQPAYAEGLAAIRHGLAGPRRSHGARACAALALLRDVASVGLLMGMLAHHHDDLREASLSALRDLTGHDHGRDLTAWRSWFHRNKTRHRMQWLIDALGSDVPSIRRRAHEELLRCSGERFAFTDDKRGRKRLAEQWQAWWGTQGRFRFAA